MRAAIEAGELDPQRFANYLKLRDEVAGAADTPGDAARAEGRGEGGGKALNKRLDEKYGKH